MLRIHKITDSFYVAPQISAEDVDALVDEGFGAVIMNRPDQETPDQPPTEEISDRADTHNVPFFHIPIQAPPQLSDIDATFAALEATKGKKVLAFCRSGTRSATLWAYTVVRSGEYTVDGAINAAREAGYDLAPHRPVLEDLASLKDGGN